MKLKEFRVREFRSVWDSGSVKVDESVTCLVGKNESGKTALLTALYRTNPIIPPHANYSLVRDYPKHEVEEYRFAVEAKERDEAVVVECLWELEDDDYEVVANQFGDETLESRSFQRKTFYGARNSVFLLEAHDAAARSHLASNPDFPDDLQAVLTSASDWDEFEKELNDAETSEAVRSCQELVSKVKEKGLGHYIFNSLIWPRAPKFLYFDEYYQMKGRENLNALIQRVEGEDLEGADQPLLGLINLARLDVRELTSVKNTTDLKNKLEGAGNHLTRRIIEYWSQNKHLQMRFDVRDAKPEDPPGMREGVNVWGEVYDTVHLASTPLGSRSRGFVWFFSFLAWYEDVKRKGEKVILLLDEPGLSLHGRAQGDLLSYFDKELADRQLVYSTHSPFMIDPDHFDRVRIVQDLGIDSDKRLPEAHDGTKVITNVLEATDDSLFPLQGALGYEIHQTLFVGPNCLVVEGPSDMIYLRAVSSQLEREGRVGLSPEWTITPVGGSGKVPTFVALLAPQNRMNIATLLDVQAKDRTAIEGLYKKKLLSQKQVMTYADFLPQEEADIEDLFDWEFYIELVNVEFSAELGGPITMEVLNTEVPRIVSAIETVLAARRQGDGRFNHYRPARYLAENVEELWPTISDATKARFEAVFRRANELLA